jgi:hypothetical protein
LVINEAGKSSDDTEDTVYSCKAFRPTKRDVTNFFLRSYAVPAKMGTHDRYSPCYASGLVEFSDNTRGNWRISSGGTGTLNWDTGDIVYLFYPHSGWKDPFACTYGVNDEGDC